MTRRRAVTLLAGLAVAASSFARCGAAEQPGSRDGQPPATAVTVAASSLFVGSAHPIERFRLYSLAGLIDSSLTLAALRTGEAACPRPISSPPMDPLLRRSLLAAFPLAVGRLVAVPGCAALYQRLGADGLALLATTVYVGPTTRGRALPCDTLQASAYTGVGQHTTVICHMFAELPPRRAAVTLLHEALHYAGMTESPADPTALTSVQISALVSGRCGL